MSELTYYPATENDVPVIFSLCKALIDAYEDVSAIDYDRVLAWVREKIQKTIFSYTRVLNNGEIVGYYCLTKQQDGWELDDFYVLPQYRNQGIGTRVLERCVQEADGPIYLYVFTKNAGAISLYERFGFLESQKVGNTRLILRYDG